MNRSLKRIAIVLGFIPVLSAGVVVGYLISLVLAWLLQISPDSHGWGFRGADATLSGFHIFAGFALAFAWYLRKTGLLRREWLAVIEHPKSTDITDPWVLFVMLVELVAFVTWMLNASI